MSSRLVPSFLEYTTAEHTNPLICNRQGAPSITAWSAVESASTALATERDLVIYLTLGDEQN
jgi:hypothetical protein